MLPEIQIPRHLKTREDQTKEVLPSTMGLEVANLNCSRQRKMSLQAAQSFQLYSLDEVGVRVAKVATLL